MGILEGLTAGFSSAVSIEVLPYLLAGALFGLVVGIIPGIGGHFALAMAVPFIYTMKNPAVAIAFILAAHGNTTQGGSITAILFGLPGIGSSAAAMMDGNPLTQQGRAGIAVGASLTACWLGATCGALVLAMMIPVLRQVVLVFGPPEIFMLAMLALTLVAALAKEELLRSLIAALLGLLLSFVGLDNVTNQVRFAFGSLSLWDGIALVPLILGLFGVSEMLSLWLKGGSSLASGASDIVSGLEMQKQIFQGVKETFKRWWLVVRCGTLGTIVGLIPGLGMAPAAFLAYGHAKQTSRDPSSFGKGNIEGVIGPESANDAVEGGALATTIAFGIPGSSSMAIMLGALLILGIKPGTEMLTHHVDLIFVMVFTMILANFIGTVVGMFIINPLARVTFLRGSLLAPILIIVVFAGSYVINNSLFDIGTALVFGLLGYAMKVYDYSRAALLIGFVLGLNIEKNLHLAVQIHGPFFFLKPIPIILLIVTFVVLVYNILDIIKERKRTQNLRGIDADVQ